MDACELMVKQPDPRDHAANQWLTYPGLFSLFLAICFLVLPLHVVGQIPLQIPLSTSPNPNTGRRAEYLLSGDALAPRQRGGESAIRVVEEVQALEDNLSTAVRHHAIANSKLRLTKGYLDVTYAELRMIGFSLLAAGDFVGLGATLAGIPGVIVIEDSIVASVETVRLTSPLSSSILTPLAHSILKPCRHKGTSALEMRIGARSSVELIARVVAGAPDSCVISMQLGGHYKENNVG